MKKAFYSSLFIHGLIFVFIFITLPKIKTKEIDYISVEIINEGIKKEKKAIVVKEIKVNKKTAIKAAPPKQKPKSTPKINEAVEIIKKINIKPKPPQKKPKIIPPKEKIIQIKEKPKDKNDDDLFNDMLKNLAENQPKPIKPIKPIKEIAKQPQTKQKKSKEEIKNIKRSIINSISIQIRANYTIPPVPDHKLANEIAVQIRIYVRPDGTINKTIIDKSSLKKAQDDPTYLPYVEAVQRALKRLGKFNKLPPEEYNFWKIINITFTPYKT